jgi:hypothetical protein
LLEKPTHAGGRKGDKQGYRRNCNLANKVTYITTLSLIYKLNKLICDPFKNV